VLVILERADPRALAGLDVQLRSVRRPSELDRLAFDLVERDDEARLAEVQCGRRRGRRLGGLQRGGGREPEKERSVDGGVLGGP
jgi:hypothetical protein